jgi:hypothetical protein
MPAEQRFVMEEESSGLRSGFQLAEAGKERSIRWPHGRAGHLPAEDGNLVTEHDDLDAQIGLVRPSQEEDLDGPEKGDILASIPILLLLQLSTKRSWSAQRMRFSAPTPPGFPAG